MILCFSTSPDANRQDNQIEETDPQQTAYEDGHCDSSETLLKETQKIKITTWLTEKLRCEVVMICPECGCRQDPKTDECNQLSVNPKKNKACFNVVRVSKRPDD